MGLFSKKEKYILIRNDRIEKGKGTINKQKQLRLKNGETKHPKMFYLTEKGEKIYLFFDRLIDSVKFDFSLYADVYEEDKINEETKEVIKGKIIKKGYDEQLRQEVENIQATSGLIMSEMFTKGILEIDKDQRLFLILLLFIMLLGGIGVGAMMGFVIAFLF